MDSFVQFTYPSGQKNRLKLTRKPEGILMLFHIRALIFLGCLLGLQGQAQAQSLPFAETMLVEILSEPENNLYHQLFLHLNDAGDVEQISRVSKESSQVVTLDELLTKQVVLARTSGLDAVLLSCAGCDPSVGGTLVLRYVYNGVTRSYRTFSMRVARNDSSWDLSTSAGEAIRTLTLKSRKVLGTVVGIREIVVNEYEPTRQLRAAEGCLDADCDDVR